eukprot:gnl/MRDRNA2_/MRDRNA2_147204_c0_seq1.p1 gnl/MRDRNA2_/MRDRNA2_147204_c0~~gnl/MRDRNA2_/MRDRNA2_147204_c0_seq1.p1  ORF type:complete len:383 (-),score=80.68 gnl/MRDRNA2_/MRDRNA2_147204_c0_seq1:48-1139(-)
MTSAASSSELAQPGVSSNATRGGYAVKSHEAAPEAAPEADGDAACEADGEADEFRMDGEHPSSGSCHSPKALKKRGKKKKQLNRVTWDEIAIAEHDKERGTRQKIDEPDTPYIRSPMNESEDEDEFGGLSPKVLELDQKDVANKLSAWMLHKQAGDSQRARRSSRGSSGDKPTGPGSASGGSDADEGFCSGSSSASDLRHSLDGSARPRRGSNPLSSDSETDGVGSRIMERRVSLPEESELPVQKPASEEWKAKRAQHYDEIATIRARAADDGDERRFSLVGFQEDPCPDMSRPNGPERSINNISSPSSPPGGGTRSKEEEEDFKAKRKGHYGDMAAALRAAKAMMDEDEDEDSEEESDKEPD